MKGIIIATHGQLAKGLQDAIQVITGMGDQVEAMSLNREDNIEEFERNLLEKVSAYQEEGSLVFVDMLGGSPYNVASKHLEKDFNYEMVTGVNLPMLLEVLTNKEHLTIPQLSLLARQAGQESVDKFPSADVEETRSDTEETNPAADPYGTGGVITFARVDNRLLHGQVVTKWLKIARADTVIIVDDNLYEDKMMADIYRNAAPSGVEVIIAPSEVIAYAQQNGTLPRGNVMLLFKDVKAVEQAYEEGLRLEKLQLGGIPNDGTREMVFTAVSLSKEEVAILDRVNEAGTNIDLQVVPEERGISYAEAKRRLRNN